MTHHRPWLQRRAEEGGGGEGGDASSSPNDTGLIRFRLFGSLLDRMKHFTYPEISEFRITHLQKCFEEVYFDKPEASRAGTSLRLTPASPASLPVSRADFVPLV